MREDLATLRKLLSDTPFFAGLSVEAGGAVAARLRPVRFSAGQSIFARGDPGQDLYLVLSGRVRLSVLTPEGRELALTHAAPGQLFGEMAVIDGGPRSAEATAITATQAFALARPILMDLMRDQPGVGLAVAQFLSRRLRETNEKLEAIALLPIEARLARYFVAALKREGDGRRTLALGMSQGELALLLGATRPKVNAALIELESIGAITRNEQGTFVCDPGLLAEAAGLDPDLSPLKE